MLSDWDALERPARFTILSRAPGEAALMCAPSSHMRAPSQATPS